MDEINGERVLDTGAGSYSEQEVAAELEGEGFRFSSVSQLDEDLATKSLGGHWQRRERAPALIPFLWRWENIYSGLLEAGRLVELGEESQRRTVQLINPVLFGSSERRATSRTIQMSVQLLKPGESARAHRHTAQAIRFVVSGHGAYTTVEGERFRMEPNDLILTPGWTWHDHFNAEDEPVIWLDGLDIPLALHLDAQFQVNFSESAQKISVPEGTSYALASPARLIPPERNDREFPPYRYVWGDTWKALEKLSMSGDEFVHPHDGLILEYSNPYTGGPTLPTLSCRVQLLRPGLETDPHKHTGTAIYHVIQGSGRTMLEGGAVIEWGERDCFVIPSWQEHRFANNSLSDDAILFSMTDRPVLEALRLYREEKC